MNRGDKNRWRKKKKRKELGKVEPVIGRSTILPRRNQRSPNPNQKRKDARNFPGILALPQLFSPFLYGGGGMRSTREPAGINA